MHSAVTQSRRTSLQMDSYQQFHIRRLDELHSKAYIQGTIESALQAAEHRLYAI